MLYTVYCAFLVRTGNSERLEVLASSQLVLPVAVQVLCTQAGGGEQDGQQQQDDGDVHQG